MEDHVIATNDKPGDLLWPEIEVMVRVKNMEFLQKCS